MATTSSSIVVTAAGASVAIPINLRTFKYGVGILVTIPSGSSATYDVEVTGDEINGTSALLQNLSAGLVNWNKHDVLQGKSASANSNLAYPVTAVRLKVASVTGYVVLSVVQALG